MNPSDEALALWERALTALKVARSNLALDADAAASRAYYAAFFAVSAHFMVRGQGFRKHSALEAAVHRDLVKAGVWSARLGEAYSALVRLRTLSDYGTLDHVPAEEARVAVETASQILCAVATGHPAVFTLPA